MRRKFPWVPVLILGFGLLGLRGLAWHYQRFPTPDEAIASAERYVLRNLLCKKCGPMPEAVVSTEIRYRDGSAYYLMTTVKQPDREDTLVSTAVSGIVDLGAYAFPIVRVVGLTVNCEK